MKNAADNGSPELTAVGRDEAETIGEIAVRASLTIDAEMGVTVLVTGVNETCDRPLYALNALILEQKSVHSAAVNPITDPLDTVETHVQSDGLVEEENGM